MSHPPARAGEQESPLLERARNLIRQGRMEEAERTYAELLGQQPGQLEALNVVALGALRRGDTARAIALLEGAVGGGANAGTLKNLGLAYQRANRLDEAAGAFRQALTLAPDHFVARLHLAHVLRAQGRHDAATPQGFAAIAQAQKQGQWRNDVTTPPALREIVKSEMRLVAQARHALFAAALEPLRRQHGSDALKRVEKCLAIYLGDLPLQYADPRQRPSFLYFPDLPAQPYLPLDLFPWLTEWEAQTQIIRAELEEALRAGGGREKVYFTEAEEAVGLRGSRGKPVWDGIYFYRHGARREENCQRCPRTIAALDALPLVRIREHAPEVMLSVLTPGSHILPHRGVTNTRVVAHLPLIVPPDCALNVGGELHAWREGRAVVFDDTYEHEAWNRSADTRVVLIADIWNPYLTGPERDAVAVLTGAIGDFRKAVEAA